MKVCNVKLVTTFRNTFASQCMLLQDIVIVIMKSAPSNNDKIHNIPCIPNVRIRAIEEKSMVDNFN